MTIATELHALAACAQLRVELDAQLVTLLERVESSIADPAEYQPSRIRHAARDARRTLDTLRAAERTLAPHWPHGYETKGPSQ